MTLVRSAPHGLALLAASISLVSCDALSGLDPDPGTPPEGTRVVFQHRDAPGAAGRFTAITTDSGVLATAAAQLALPVGERLLHVEGPIARGNAAHNEDWSWHFAPSQWSLREVSIELCDGTPEMVEADLDTWVDTVGSFCPWSAYVAAIE